MDIPGQESGDDNRRRNNDQDDRGGSDDHQRPFCPCSSAENTWLKALVINGGKRLEGRACGLALLPFWLSRQGLEEPFCLGSTSLLIRVEGVLLVVLLGKRTPGHVAEEFKLLEERRPTLGRSDIGEILEHGD
jgi:hypothetical protein